MELSKEQEELYQEVVQKAWEDADFKARLVANPIATIEALTGKKLNLPEGKNFVVRDQTDENKVFLNIPAVPEVDVVLTEEELERVAGGCQHGPDSGQPKPIIIGYPPKNPLEDLLFDI